MERQHDQYATIKVEEMIKNRKMAQKKEHIEIIKNKGLIQKTLAAIRGKEVSEQEVVNTISWLEKVSKYVPIASDRELEEIVKIMVLLSKERAKLNELYDKPGLNLMKRVREGMIRYMVVLSELRARRKEYLEHWFTDEYWISEWSRVLLDLKPEDNMVKYGFDDIKTKDFLFLLELELAAADDASKVEKPMIRLQPVANKDSFIIIPTEIAASDYKIQVDRIVSNDITFTQWVRDTLISLKLPN
ncbi:MAG: hypothetical protein EAX86_07305 [Candidatus Heimdallarchaeota archaeon]|nr:hypothetical protein [Candidatus Heimdallarchaeota archaeon]